MSMTAPGRQIFNRWCQSLGILPPLSSHGFARTSSSHTNNLNAGEGTLGQLLKDKQLYENMNRTILELQSFLAEVKKDPKKYLNVKVSIF